MKILNLNKKAFGQVFTPSWIVDSILDRVGYFGKGILNQYIMEAGCGDGNFLVEIVNRYILVGLKSQMSNGEIKKGLERYIWGVEIDKLVFGICLGRLDKIAQEYDIGKVDWNIKNINILDLDINTLPKFNFVVGNPPYIRVHNMDKDRLIEIKEKFEFCKKGIIDMFLVFFEVGLNLLEPNKGKLGFITPNSFIHNSTYAHFRQYLIKHNLVKDLIDFKQNMVFEGVSTYTAITIVDKRYAKPFVNYFEFVDGEIQLVDTINTKKLDLKKWNLNNTKDADFLSSINNRKNKISDFAVVQYGFATLLDSAYILENNLNADSLFSNFDAETDVVFPVVKGSKYDGGLIKQQIIYPYHKTNERWLPIPENQISSQYPNVYDQLKKHKIGLENRSYDKTSQLWYEYGRSQGIQTIHNPKLVFNPIFKHKIQVFEIDAKTMVYSGIYIFLKPNSKITLDYIKQILISPDFLRYATLMGKDMRGGYKNINTTIIKDYKFSSKQNPILK